jgi:hypothetical protein
VNDVVEVFIALSVEEEGFGGKSQTAPVDHIELIEDGIKNAARKSQKARLLVDWWRICVMLKELARVSQ